MISSARYPDSLCPFIPGSYTSSRSSIRMAYSWNPLQVAAAFSSLSLQRLFHLLSFGDVRGDGQAAVPVIELHNSGVTSTSMIAPSSFVPPEPVVPRHSVNSGYVPAARDVLAGSQVLDREQ